MPTFVVLVTIENKPELSDPEGETILKDLVLKGTNKPISEIRTAKMLRLKLDAPDGESAQNMAKEICDELHLYNPLVSRIGISFAND